MRRIEESKRQMRRRLAVLPFAEKLRILEELRERALELGASPLRQCQSERLGKQEIVRRTCDLRHVSDQKL